MIIKINRMIYNLYKQNKLDFEVSLNWILGYLCEEYTKQYYDNEIKIAMDNFFEVEISNKIVNDISDIFNTRDNSTIINILLMNAFFLGGNE